MSKIFLLTLIFCILHQYNACIHDTFAANTTKHFLNDLTDSRLLASN